MQSSIRYDPEPIKQNTDWELPMLLSTDTGVRNLSGYKAKLVVREEMNSSATKLAEISSTGANVYGSIITIASGYIIPTIVQEETKLFTWDEGWYDLTVTTSTSEGSLVKTPLYGKLTMLRNVST